MYVIKDIQQSPNIIQTISKLYKAGLVRGNDRGEDEFVRARWHENLKIFFGSDIVERL